ncbi:AMP-binding protein [Allorhizocola rhizosphaerae]|uniref:AMP-binding protein n=1 Tax=Allorhizocola rhizosphaerae TaxID=1872709 RepID=UPI000E3BD080|nr:AMP-binding protein [Allorhizocola rhizosphaerae]
MTGVLGWMDRASQQRGIRFAAPDGQWRFWSYARLAEETARVAGGLCAAGVQPGQTVSIVQRSGPGFVVSLFGAMLAGAVPSPVAPSGGIGGAAAFKEHLSWVLSVAKPAAVLADEDFADLVPAAVHTVAQIRANPVDATPTDTALLQFTSGSTGRCRGVRISHQALAANVAAIRSWIGLDGSGTTVSWLPVHHDMGLTGCLITPMVDGSDIWLLSPEEFIRRPLRYLRCFGEEGAQYSAMPRFALEHVVRRVPPQSLAGMDFSALRALVVGAERIDASVLEQFTDLLSGHGFTAGALRPAYGLAEATLAVTGLPRGETWRAVERDGVRVVGCGPPLPGVSLSIQDEQGRPLPDGCVGEIVVSGASIADDYTGTLRTGDAGWLEAGELYVLGRLGDGIKVRGRHVFAEDLEATLVGLGASSRHLAVLLGNHGGRDTAVAVVEEKGEPGWLHDAAKALRVRVDGAAVVVVAAPPRTIPRTTSGKPRRRELWQRFAAGQLPGRVLVEEEGRS